MSGKTITGLSRRNFSQFAAIGCVGVTTTACHSSADSGADNDLERLFVASLTELGDGDVIDFDYPTGHAAFLVKLAQPATGGVGEAQDIVAFHRACTHQGCPINELNVERGQLGPCPCHLSVFDLCRGGAQVTGRATQNLVQIRLEVSADAEIYATGLEGVPFGEAFTTRELL